MDRMTPKLAAMVGLVKGQCNKIEHVTLSVPTESPRNYFYLTTVIGTWFRVTVEEVGPEREP